MFSLTLIHFSIVWFCTLLIALAGLLYAKHKITTLQNIILKHSEEIEKERKRAIAKHKQVVKGYTAEHFAPFKIPEYLASDYFFINGPVDFIIFESATGVRNKTTDQIDKIIFLDIKSGNANLSTLQRRVRDAIKDGRVVFQTYHSDTEELKTW